MTDEPMVLLVDEAFGPAPAADPRRIVADVLDKMRAMCGTDTDAGVAAYMRLDDDEPVDEDGAHLLPPVLAVPVTEILALVDEAQTHLSRSGEVDRFRRLINQVVRMGRKSEIHVKPEWPIWQYPTIEALEEACRTGEAYDRGIYGGQAHAYRRSGGPLWQNTRPDRPLLDAGRDGAVESMLWAELSKTGTFPAGRMPYQLRHAINAAPAFRFASIPQIQRTELYAALGVLTAHGRCEIVPGRVFRYRATVRAPYAAGAQGVVALAVVILGLINPRKDGLVMAEIVDHVQRRYQMRPGVDVTREDIIAAIAFLARKGYAAVRLGRYVSTGGDPIGDAR